MYNLVSVTTIFKSGDKTLPYRLSGKWKTVKGALRAGEKFALSLYKLYIEGSVNRFNVEIFDETGLFITNMAC